MVNRGIGSYVENRAGFDPNTTVRWVTGMLKDPDGTAAAYRETRAPWQQTFVQITLPVYVVSAVAGFVLSLVFGRPFLYGAEAGAPAFFLVSLLWSVAFLFVVVFIFDYFAGTFGGQREYNASFAALSLAWVPALVGGILSPLPLIGWIIGFAAAIYGLVLLYRLIPLFMGVPQDKRVVHFVVSLLVAFVVNLIVAGLLAAAFLPDFDDMASDTDRSGSGGVLTDFERQANVAEEAAQDVYDPPADGRLTDAQVAAYVRTLQRTAELRERLGGKYQNMDEQEPSIGDVFGGVKDMMRIGTAEMEVVKTGGGNWAEHQWVRNQIEVARIQRDSTPAVEHNYELFLEYQDEIEQYD